MFVDPIKNWAVGTANSVSASREYFDIILKGVIGRYYTPKTLAESYLKQIETETLLILGSNDNLVGNPRKAKDYAKNIPHLYSEVLDSGHLINVEKSDEFNKIILDFIK